MRHLKKNHTEKSFWIATGVFLSAMMLFATIAGDGGTWQAPAEDTWLDEEQARSSDWGTYGDAISVAPATPMANYVVRFDIPASFNYGLCKTGGDDIRFFDSANTSLPYWIETWVSGGVSTIWVKVPLAGTTSFTMRYGNVSASPASSGESTFELFDDFSGSSVNVSKWSVYTDSYSTATVSGGQLHLVVDTISDWNGLVIVGFHDTYINSGLPSATIYNNGVRFGGIDNVVTQSATVATSTAHNISSRWFTAETRWINSTRVDFYDDDSLVATHVTNIPTTNLPVRLLTRLCYAGPGTHFGSYVTSQNTTIGRAGKAMRTNFYCTQPLTGAIARSDYNWVFVRSCVADEPVAFIDNQEPTLTNDKVSPTSGNQLTTFNFSVVFTDGDNAPPGLIYMKLNGTSFPLVKSNPSDTTYSDGCQYEVCHYLQPGSYNYSFECVQSAIVSTPTWSNLTVTETNTNVPWLTNTAVTPDAGSNTTIFSFNTFYHDLDNNMPETINVVINGSVFPMVEADPCDSYVVDGKQYVHSTTLDWGYHEYEVQCFDGLYSNTSGILYSPEVFPFQYSNVTFFSEDFESGNLSKWATVTGLWHVTSTWPKPWADAYPWEPCHSPSNGMWVGSEVSGLYSSSHTAELVSVPIEITDITQSAYLEFFHWQNTESSWDYCRVYVRVNGGSWISLYSYTGSVSPWQRQLYDLSAYCTPGNTLELRFQFTSDTSVEYRGWVVDDIKLFTNGSLSAPVLISPPNGAPVVAGNQAFTWNNIGDVGPFSYEWQLSSTSNFSVVLDSVVGIPETPGSTSVVRDMSSYSGIYYWRARAVAGPIIGAWSSSFTINFTGASSDDDYEENDNYLEAYDISGYNATWLSSISGAGINTDDDYYEIAVPGGNESLYILAMFTHAEGDINIQLLDDSGLYVTGSFGTSDLEIINTTVSLAGIYYIYVYGPDLESTYDLYWQCSPPVVVVDDNYEENNDAGSAYSLVLYEDTWLTSINGTGIYNDDDFYEIAVSSGNESLHVLATFSSMVGGMFLYLFNSTLDLVASEFPTLDQVLLEEILPAGGGTYYVCITGTTPGMTYDLRWWTTVPPLEDLYEENDDPSTAFNLTSYENTWLSSIYGKGRCNDPDYYEIAAASGSEYIEVQLDSGIGMSSISLLDTSYATIVSYQHRILYRVPDGGGTYYLLVSSSTQGCIYDLIWNTTAPPLDDAYEENDNNVTAYDLTSNEGTWLSSIAGTGISLDDDYYRIDVTLANPLIAISINITGDGVMKCQLVDENGTSYLMQDLISNKDSQLRFLLSQAGTYYLRLYSSVAGCTYDVRWTGSAVPVDDTYEENDHPMVATNLAAHAGQWLSGINGTAVLLDDDFYQVEVPSGHGFLDVAVNFTQAYGAEIYLLLFDASFNNIGYGIRPAGPGGVNYGVNCTPGFYFVYVYAGSFYPASGLSYDLKYETSPLPVDDNYEINDDPPTAYDLNVHEGTWLSSINGTGLLYNIRGTPMVYDYFKIQVGPGPERVDVQLLTNETRAPVMLAILNSGGSPVMYMAMEDLMKSNITITSVLFPGTYFIIVFTYEPIGQEYDLKWEGSPPTTIPDVPVLVTPANGSTIPTNWAFLSAMVSDPDGDRLDVYFFNATDDSLLGA